jgi:hypothetical protein
MPVATVKGVPLAQIAGPPLKNPYYNRSGPSENLSWYNAGGTAMSYSGAGQIAGSIVGCVGMMIAVPVALMGSCAVGMGLGSRVGGAAGAGIGFFVGGFNSSHSSDFDFLPNNVMPELGYY